MDPQIAAIDYEHFFSAKMMRTNVGTPPPPPPQSRAEQRRRRRRQSERCARRLCIISHTIAERKKK